MDEVCLHKSAKYTQVGRVLKQKTEFQLSSHRQSDKMCFYFAAEAHVLWPCAGTWLTGGEYSGSSTLYHISLCSNNTLLINSIPE